MAPLRTHEPPSIPLDEVISHDELAAWVASGAARRSGAVLTTHDGRVYALLEVVRVLGSSAATRPGGHNGSDPYGFTGLVDTVGNMLRRGFVMSAERVALGRRAYDVEYGFLAQPMRTPDESDAHPRLG